jgi:thiosulfate/3-mercaptopyruvate sulfurtransferase
MASRASDRKRLRVDEMPYTTLVSTDALAANLGGWIVVDCCFDLKNEERGHEEYLARHIPGAMYVSLSKDLAGARGEGTGRHPLPTPGKLAEVFGRLGIGDASQVVAYDQDSGVMASRLWWCLRYLGHESVAVLDGGLTKWLREGRPTHAGRESNPPATFTPRPQPALQVGVDDIIADLQAQRRLLVDARSPERFEGRSEPIDRVAGHIPGARNSYYQCNLASDGTMLAPDALRETYQALLGRRAPTEVVMYCGSGVTACHNLLAMAHAGLPGAALFVGSWSQWSSDPERPIETGPAE